MSHITLPHLGHPHHHHHITFTTIFVVNFDLLIFSRLSHSLCTFALALRPNTPTHTNILHNECVEITATPEAATLALRPVAWAHQQHTHTHTHSQTQQQQEQQQHFTVCPWRNCSPPLEKAQPEEQKGGAQTKKKKKKVQKWGCLISQLN